MTGGQLVRRWKAPGLPVIAAVILFASAFADAAELTASWIDNSLGVAHTRIERRGSSDPAFQVIADVPPGVTVYVDSTVAPGQTYCYRALAYDGNSASPYSSEACGVAGDRFGVNVRKSGNGAGTVTSAPAGISCGSACSAVFAAGGAVILSATPGPGSTFVGWSGGGCAGTQPCTVAGNGAVAISASFAPAPSTPVAAPRSKFSGRCPLPGGVEVGVPYFRPCAVSGGQPPYSCVLVGGALPQGLSLERECRISGTPVRAGVTIFTARIADASGKTVDYTDSASVLGAVSIRTTTLPHAVIGRAFSAALAPAGGRAPYQWAVVDGTLPAGLALDPARGIIAGQPSAVGVSGVTVRVRDARGGTSDRALRIVVGHGRLTATCELGPAAAGLAFFDACAPRAGLPPYSCAVAHGTLPPGLMLNPDCTLRGVPATAGVSEFGARVSDSGGTSVVTAARIVVQPHVAIGTSSVPPADANRPYSTVLAATGGVRPYRWVLSSGSLPRGLALDPVSGYISGRATDVGVTTAVLRVTDAVGGSEERPVRLVVNQGPLTATCHPAPAVVGAPYAKACMVHGGLAPYSCEAVAGTGIPPAGLTVNRDCTITGTPTTSGATSFTTRVRDSGGSTVNVASYVLVRPPLGITTAALPLVIVNQSLLLTLAASGGLPPYTWSVVNGILPDGLALNLANGEISGIPTADGIVPFTIRVRDARGAIADRSYWLVVSDAL